MITLTCIVHIYGKREKYPNITVNNSYIKLPIIVIVVKITIDKLYSLNKSFEGVQKGRGRDVQLL